MIAVTSETSPLAKSDDYLAAFFMDDYIGGRYSSTSAVGGAVLSLAFGPDVFARFLNGAAAEDETAKNTDIMKNAAMLDALIGVYERNVLGYPATTVLPYSQALSRFPAHLQQLDMESNGKSVNRFGEPVDYPTGPVLFGEPGTNGQHSFYQLLHQGTDIVPLVVHLLSLSVSSLIQRHLVHCLHISRTRLCSRDSCGTSTASIRKVFSSVRYLQRRYLHTRQMVR